MKKRYITWEEVFERLSEVDSSFQIIYGVPKGGMILTAFLNNAAVVHDPKDAILILDDVYDSGSTFDFYNTKYPKTQFHALFDKQKEPLLKDKWLVFPWEAEHPKGEDTIEENIIRQLQYIGEDVDRDGLKDTPKRIVKSWDELFSGYKYTPAQISQICTSFENEEGYDQIILLKDIDLYSMCEHHMLPFFGRAHVAYIPTKKYIGVSKLARIVDIFARRLQIQERIGEQVTDYLMVHLNPLGAACIIEATHMCMRMRGVSKQQSTMVTSSLRGIFLNDETAKEELLQLIKR